MKEAQAERIAGEIVAEWARTPRSYGNWRLREIILKVLQAAEPEQDRSATGRDAPTPAITDRTTGPTRDSTC